MPDSEISDNSDARAVGCGLSNSLSVRDSESMPEPIPEVLTYVVSKSLAATVPVAGACTVTVCKALPAEMATLAIY